MTGPDFSSADFHRLVHQQVTRIVQERLIDTKLEWDLVAPLVTAARELCRSDLDAMNVRIHGVSIEPDGPADAEEAYLALSVPDRDGGPPWISRTYWLSDIALVDQDPVQVRQIAEALERSLARLRTWLAEQDARPPEV